MSAISLRDLRALLDAQFPDAIPVPRRTAEVVATGVEVVDAILPNGGFPRGRLSVWAPGGGASAVLRASCLATYAAGERAAWIDGAGTIAGPFWQTGPLLVRPQSRVHALRAAETLIRSGGFALVVLSGVEPEGTENVRLSRAAHDGGGAVVAVTNGSTTAGLKIVSRIEPHDYRWRCDPHGAPAAIEAAVIHVRVASFGWNRRARVQVSAIGNELRAALDPLLPDRRGTFRGRSAPMLRPRVQRGECPGGVGVLEDETITSHQRGAEMPCRRHQQLVNGVLVGHAR